MTTSGISTRVLLLALIAPCVAACSWDYTPQRSPDMLSANPSPAQGRVIKPGEADNYQEWLAGEPDQLNALPWKKSVIAKPAPPAPPLTVVTTPAPTSSTTTGWTTTTTSTSTMSRVNTPVGVMHIQEQYPPYSSQ